MMGTDGSRQGNPDGLLGTGNDTVQAAALQEE